MKSHGWGLAVLVTGVLIGCATTSPPPTYEPARIDPGTVLPKVTDFAVIFDDSGSMGTKRHGVPKLETARSLTAALLATAPPLDYRGTVRTFGQGRCLEPAATSVLWGPEAYRPDAASEAVRKIDCQGGRSPLSAGLDAVAGDLGSGPGRKAVLIVSDGLRMGQDEIAAAGALASRYSDRLCIYAIHVGDSVRGRTLLQRLVDEAACGQVASDADLAAPGGVEGLVREALLAPDGDGDGVADASDRCPDTPRGAVVDAAGCPTDSDGDRVYDGLDRCPDTPKGARVDAGGCPTDSDGDGVADGLDACPDTPRGTKVDGRGCTVAPPKAPPVFQPGATSLVLKGVNFPSNQATLTPQSHAVLDEVARSLKDWPEVRVEVAGHTDSQNSEAYNQKLSERRAQAVMDYLVARGIDRSRLVAKGYGEAQPIADNRTADGRGANRRVELRKLS